MDLRMSPGIALKSLGRKLAGGDRPFGKTPGGNTDLNDESDHLDVVIKLEFVGMGP